MKPYPLNWPEGRARQVDRSSPRTRYSIARTIPLLLEAFDKLGAGTVIITSYAKLKANGLPYSDGDQPRNVPDPGVAIWFQLNRAAVWYCISCDGTDTIGGNLREIGLAVAELRNCYRRLGMPLAMLLVGFIATPTRLELPKQPAKVQLGPPIPPLKSAVPAWAAVLGFSSIKGLTWAQCLSTFQRLFRDAQTQRERDNLVEAQTDAARHFKQNI